MNKQPLDMARAVGAKLHSEPPMRKVTGVSMTFEELDQFAKLVVRECVDILMKPEWAMNNPDSLSNYNRGWVNGRLLGIDHIKEQFGIEE